MNDTPRPHPLDANDDDDSLHVASYEPASPALAYQPLLKPSLMVAAVATATLFLSSVVSIITPLNSGFNLASIFAFRLSGTVLVLALGAVLVAYRIGHLRRQRYRPNWQLDRVFSGYRGFLVANLFGLVLVWTGLLFFGWIFGGSMVLISGPVMMIVAGLLANMSIWHQGYLRAFAIGSLTALIIQLFPATAILAALVFGGGFPRGNGGIQGAVNMFVMSSGVILTVSQLSGLVSSGYVVALESRSIRNNNNPPQSSI